MNHLEYQGYFEEKLLTLATGDYPQPVDEADGISVCTSCGARYAGNMNSRHYNHSSWATHNTNHCTNVVFYAETRWNNRKIVKKEDIPKYHEITKVFYKPCGSSYYNWSLQEQYQEYKDFKDFIEGIVQYNNHYQRFSKFLTEEARSLIVNSLPSRIDFLEHQNRQLVDAIQELARKINDAGNSLRF
jgi:hypothetical protein